MNTSAGLHMTIGNHDGFETLLKRTVAAGKPLGLVYVLADGGGLETQTWSPTTPVVFRCWGPKYTSEDTPPGNWGDSNWTNIPQMARDWMAELYPLWEMNPAHYHEFLNEPDPAGKRAIEYASEFVQRCMEDAEAHGFKTSIWSFTAGLPRTPTVDPRDYPQAEAILPTLKWAAEHGHALSLHDGSVNPDRRLLKQAYEDKTALRYRYVKALMDARGWPMPLVHLTEVYQIDGYRRPDWGDWNWYLTEVHKDDYVSGAAWFTLGDYVFGGHGSDSVNVVDQLERFGDLIVGKDWIAPEPMLASEDAVFLNVPFIPQIGPGADFTNNDCGTADLAMMAVALGDPRDEVDYWSRAAGAVPGALITIGQLQQAAAANGYVLTRHNNQSLASLRAMLEKNRPAMLLINAGVGWEHQPGYTGPHFALATGFSRKSDAFYFHDSYFVAGKRGGAYVRQTHLAEAWGSCHLQGNNPDFLFMTLDRPVPVPIPPAPSPQPTPVATLSGVGMGVARPMTVREAEAVHTSGVRAFKALTIQDPGEARELISQVRAIRPDMTIAARLMFPPDEQNHTLFPAQRFVDYCLGPALVYHSLGVHYFEVHNEPNLTVEGLGWQWANGAEFAEWFVAVRNLLRAQMPDAKLGFPGVSPQESDWAGVYEASDKFLQEARPAVLAADWLGVHSYWNARGTGRWQMSSEDYGGWYYRRAQRAWPDKLIYLTEFSCNDPNIGDEEKGQMYGDYLKELPGVTAAFAFCLSRDWDPYREGWVRYGSMTGIPASLGKMK